MKSRLKSQGMLTVGLTLVISCHAAHGFTFMSDRKSSVDNHRLSFMVDLPGVSESGITWFEAFNHAAMDWQSSTNITIITQEGPAQPCTYQETTSTLGHVGISPDACGYIGQPGYSDRVLAIAGYVMRTDTHYSNANIAFRFNSSRKWDIYDGDSRFEVIENPDKENGLQLISTNDFRRVARHELGHTLGLGHSLFPRSILNNASDGDNDAYTLTADDVCGVNILNDNPEGCPLLLPSPVTLSGDPTTATFVGGASKDRGETYSQVFAPSDVIDVMATVVVESGHQFEAGRLHTVIELSDGTALMRTNTGFQSWDGSVEALRGATSTVELKGANEIYVLKDFDLTANNISNLGVAVYVGYSLDSNPNEIYFSGTPIQFRIE